MPETKLSLHRKLAQIMYEAERIPKNGTAPREMGGYSFVQVGDAADFIRKALAEKVLTMMPTGVRIVGQQDRVTKNGGNMTTVDLITEWTITDGESGESIKVESFGAGADGGDKYSGKASTSAMKYALLTTFLLSTGEDSELGNVTAGTPGQGVPGAPTAPPPPPAQETETSRGHIVREGVIAKGAGRNSDLEWRQTPDAYHIGFLLEVGDGKARPQVSVEGPLAVSLFAATSLGGAGLLGVRVKVEGEAFEVTQPGRRAFYRIKADRLTTADWIIPPLEPTTISRDPTPDEEAELDSLMDKLPL